MGRPTVGSDLKCRSLAGEYVNDERLCVKEGLYVRAVQKRVVRSLVGGIDVLKIPPVAFIKNRLLPNLVDVADVLPKDAEKIVELYPDRFRRNSVPRHTP